MTIDAQIAAVDAAFTKTGDNWWTLGTRDAIMLSWDKWWLCSTFIADGPNTRFGCSQSDNETIVRVLCHNAPTDHHEAIRKAFGSK